MKAFTMITFHFIVLLASLAALPVFGTTAKQSSCDEYLVCRVAIDWGSGAIKINAALVDSTKNHIIDTPLLSQQISLNLTEDVEAHGGLISKEMIQKALSLLRTIKEEAFTACHSKGFDAQYAGIATAVFRRALNGNDVLDQFEREEGIRFYLISQEEEGRLGFMNARALFPDIPEETMIAWDNGNGSFQMSGRVNEDLMVYQGPTGHGTVRVILSKGIRNGSVLQAHESGNPVSYEESRALDDKITDLLPPLPAWLREKIAMHSMIITFGEGTSLFAVMAQSKATDEGISGVVEESIITDDDLKKMRDRYLGQPDEFFAKRGVYNRTLTGALYLITIMKALNISRIHYKKSLGNTAGILIACEFWNE